FACGIPVITSNCTSMPEVAGDAAVLCNPFEVDSIATAMVTMYNDKSLYGQLLERSRSQLEKFSWDKTADLLWNCIEKSVEK
ncbi:MAG: glycosyltransferase family 1 protein, partial [Bacteroidales bacterium]|nr:glycosyltransferase family 1 protein [Bacteroidales bacterium]